MSGEDFEFRAVLLKIQDSLSDADRVQLHFLFGEDIPRCLQENGSLETALKVLQTLFDRLKISSKNFEYLTRGLKAIQRHDCAQKLQDYQRLVPTEIIPLPINEQSRVLPAPRQARPTVLDEMDEEDTMVPTVIKPAATNFECAEPQPMDFKSIDLRPIEDPSSPWTEEYSKSLNLQYHPRAYQIEIVRDAVRNGNSIVCLRTGSGKTFIASILMKYYFIKKQQEQPGASFSSLFFVPRKAIRLQQAKAVVNIGNMKVDICEDDQTIDQLLGKNHVIVSTPQKLVNCLKNGTVRLSQIDLLVFDECHNTSGGNPYCNIMQFYLCPSKQETSSASATIKPRILGLTASISAKDAVEKRESVEKNLVSLCSKLACRNISTVCDPKNIEEINQEISRPSNDQFEFVVNAQFNTYFHEYLSLFDALVEQIKTLLDDKLLLKDQVTGSPSFIAQVVLLKQSCERKGAMNNTVICDYLLLLTKKYGALRDLPFEMVIRNILEKVQQYHEDYQQPIQIDNLIHDYCQEKLTEILEKHERNPTSNSKLDHLVTLMKRHADQHSKGLILAQKTFYTKTLCEYLGQHPELVTTVRPIWLVGQSSADLSQTIHDQEARLKRFREDECNVLIATDIVQEGLDIPTCSFVIRYEFVSDEIGTIQSRGRARASNSSYYLITELDSSNHVRERNNKFREQDMEEAILRWPSIDKEIFQREVDNKTTSLVREWEQSLKRELQEREALRRIGKKEGSICCRKCSAVLGELAWLKRRKTTYFINHPTFFDDNAMKMFNQYLSVQENVVMGDVKCHCGNSLGGYQKFTDRSDLGPLCALKCKQIKFRIDNQGPYVEFTQWSGNNRFDVEELEEI